MTETKTQTAKERVDALHRAIEEAQASISATAVQIKEVDERITAELQLSEPDDDRVAELEAEREELAGMLERFERRISGLEASIPEAERAVIVEELESALAAYPVTLKRANDAIARWRKRVEGLEELVKAANEVKNATAEWEELRDRIHYLETLLGIPMSELEPREIVQPQEIERAKERLQAGFVLSKWAGIVNHRTEWWRKAEELRAKQAEKSRQAELDAEYARQVNLRG